MKAHPNLLNTLVNEYKAQSIFDDNNDLSFKVNNKFIFRVNFYTDSAHLEISGVAVDILAEEIKILAEIKTLLKKYKVTLV